jgi:alpha-glucosidase
MSNWTERDIIIDFSFLGPGNYEAEIFKDGLNADKDATDYKKETKPVTATDKLSFHLAPGGGFAIRVVKRN